VEAGDGRGNEPEGGEHEITPADARHTMEDIAEVEISRGLLERRAWLRDGNEIPPRIAGRLRHLVMEISVENVGFGRAAGLARYDEQRFCEIDLRLRSSDLRRIGGIENAQFRPARLVTEDLRQHFRPET